MVTRYHYNKIPSRLYSVLLGFLVFSFALFVEAAVDVTQNITTDTVWTKESGPYVIKNNIEITPGVELLLEPGTVVKFEAARKLVVSGELTTNGNNSDKIYFTSIHDDLVGGDTNQNGTSTVVDRETRRWGGVTFGAGSSANIEYTEVRFAGYQSRSIGIQPAFTNRGGILALKNVTVFNNGYFGLGQTDGQLLVESSHIDTHEIGLAAKGGQVTIKDSQFSNSSQFAIASENSSLSVQTSQFDNNDTAVGLWPTADQQYIFQANQATNNQYNGIVLRGPVHGEIALPASDGMPYIIHGVGGSAIGAGDFSYSFLSQFTVAADAKVNFSEGVHIRSGKEDGIDIHGELNFSGTKENPVIYSAIEDMGSVSVGKAGYIHFHNGSKGQIDNVELRSGSGVYRGIQAALINDGGSVMITNTTVTNYQNNGIYHVLGTTVIGQSSFGYGVGNAVFNSTLEPLSATNNYWADPSGPKHPSINPSGMGASISDNVLVAPWFGAYPPEPPKPTGASSILFLPGIMGSHLYEDSNECFGFGEQKRWFSHTDCEQQRLLTNPDGSSVHDIYTKFEDEAIADKASLLFFTQELYTNFLAQMNALEGKEIKDFTPFPYDWRLKLDQVIRMKKDTDSNNVRYVPGINLQDGLLYKTISDMATRSHSGKVTIVSHSNGGLVAKAFMAELAETDDPLEAKIDNLILIGSPQVGTPDAVNGILHGTEIGPGGVVINQDTTRTILNTAPFGHHLLPNKHYFDGQGVSVKTPVITFKEGLATNAWRMQYGEAIDSFEELKHFLDDSSGRTKPTQDDLKTPEVVDGTLLTYAEQIGDKLATWEVPDTLTIHQLGGSGIWTPSRVEYSSGSQCRKYYPGGFGCFEYVDYPEPELHFVIDGDGTVVLPSALQMSEERVKREWLDLYKYNEEKDKEERIKVHKSMLEVPEVATYVVNIASGKVAEYTYIKNSAPTVPSDIRLLFHLHSPLDMYVTSDEGVVSSSTNEIRGAEYRRYGDLQYIWLPATIENAQLHLVGYDEGSFTLFKELWQGDEELSVVDFKALPTNAGTMVTLPISFDEAGVMEIDFNGDGAVDGLVTETQDVIQMLIETATSTPQLSTIQEKSGNSGTRITKKPVAIVAGISITQDIVQLKEIIRLLNLIINLLKEKSI